MSLDKDAKAIAALVRKDTGATARPGKGGYITALVGVGGGSVTTAVVTTIADLLPRRSATEGTVRA
jgi:hypothetical protein